MHNNSTLHQESTRDDECRLRQAHLPGNTQTLIQLLRIEEPEDILLEASLELVLQDDVVPIRFLHLCPEVMILEPIAGVEDIDLLVEIAVPDSRLRDERTRWLI